MKCKQCGGDLSIPPDGSALEFDYIALSHDEVRIVPVADGGLFRVTKDAGVFCCPTCVARYYHLQGNLEFVSHSEHQALIDATRHHVECLTDEIKGLIAAVETAICFDYQGDGWKDKIRILVDDARAKGGV